MAQHLIPILETQKKNFNVSPVNKQLLSAVFLTPEQYLLSILNVISISTIKIKKLNTVSIFWFISTCYQYSTDQIWCKRTDFNNVNTAQKISDHILLSYYLRQPKTPFFFLFFFCAASFILQVNGLKKRQHVTGKRVHKYFKLANTELPKIDSQFPKSFICYSILKAISSFLSYLWYNQN